MALTITHGKRERLNYKGATYHITSRCNNKSALFTEKSHFEDYISILKKCKEKYGFKLHNYTPMNNHTHLIVRLEEKMDISKIMHFINRWYARRYNAINKRTGHFWEERFYGELMDTDLQLLTTLVYIDANPVRANMCKSPDEWKYSGANYYINGEKNTLIDPPDIYLNLGIDKKMRQKVYRQLVQAYLQSKQINNTLK
ncbi:MAG: transposase [Candidatus Omnitrophota bacterium]